MRILPLTLSWLAFPAVLLVETQAFDRSIQPFLETHCYECHDDVTAKGGLDLFELGNDLSDEATRAKWIRIFDRVELGEMPPKEETQPSAEDRATFAKLLGAPLTEAHLADKGTVLRRLNRREYENTMNDLFGTNLKLAEMLPEDGRSHEFDNVGEALNISMVQLHRYMDAAGLVLEEAIEDRTEAPEPKTVKASYADTREAEKFIGKAWFQAPDGAVVFYKESGYPSGMLRDANTNEPGFYKIRVTGYAFQSDEPVTFSVGATTFKRGAEKPTFGYYAVPAGEPTTIELEAWLDERYMIQIEPQGIYDENNVIREKGIENYKGPGLAINHVELEGPLVSEFPSRGHRLIFEGLERKEIEPRNPNDKKKRNYQPKFEIVSANPARDAQMVLQRVASAAFRRPVEGAEVASYLDLFQTEMAQGSDFETALKTALTAVLCSPEFLYLKEPDGYLNDFALATRLSYFLNRTTPDAELRAVAEAGKLSRDPQTLLAEAERLMNEEKFDRFITDFTDAWLDLRNIEFTSPDGSLFPEFDPFLQFSMLGETRAYLRELITKNASVANLVKSDFAMLNERLARHYGIDGVTGPEIQRVSLPADSVRGGFLSQGSILKVSANGTNTSPVVRGVWVMERIMGDPPQPPPPGVPGVEPDIRGAETLRQLLDKHRSMESCNSCHSKIDPPGFALESFNPVGGWRDSYRSLGQEGEKVDAVVNGRNVRYRIGLPVDAGGNLPDGREFSGYREFRDLLAQNEDALAEAFTEKLLVFATGREMGFSDRPEIEAIVKKSAEEGHGIRDLIELVLLSKAFRQK